MKRFGSLVLASLLTMSLAYAAPPRGTFRPGAQLRDALPARVAAMHAQGKKPIVIFDIDDTLLRQPGNREIRGAAKYLNHLGASGAKVVYLTGRKTKDHDKTIASFNKNKLPLSDFTLLMLNHSKKPTVDWKKSATLEINRLGTPVAVFENEWKNLRMFRKQYPASVSVFRLETVSQSRDPGGRGEILLVKDYE